jgi:hypothetical protein
MYDTSSSTSQGVIVDNPYMNNADIITSRTNPPLEVPDTEGDDKVPPYGAMLQLR